jgi:hypothetical protein
MAAFGTRETITESTVTVNNWREVLARVNNVYTDPLVLNLRNDIVGRFTAYMEMSDCETNFNQRDGLRQAALIQLKSREADIRRLIAANNDAAGEAQVALLEVQVLAGEFKAVTNGAPPLILTLPAGRLQNQAYFYLKSGYEGLADATASMKILQKLEKIDPGAANDLCGISLPWGLVRSMANFYRLAQMDDDGVLMMGNSLLNSQLVLKEAALRDRSRAMAVETFRKFKNLLPLKDLLPPIVPKPRTANPGDSISGTFVARMQTA